MTRRRTMGASMALTASIMIAAAAQSDLPNYPEGFRRWEHVKSGLMGPQSPGFDRFGGLHHIYANDRAMEGYRTGHFPGGSVIVFDRLDVHQAAGSTTEGARLSIDVMSKDGGPGSPTGGWRFERFLEDSHTEREPSAQFKAQCVTCHTSRKDHDYVFSEYRP
jgi:hypothetical protein